MIFGRRKKKGVEAEEETDVTTAADDRAEDAADAADGDAETSDDTVADEPTDAETDVDASSDESDEVSDESDEVSDESDEVSDDEVSDDEDSDEDAVDDEATETDRWADFDKSQDWREEGPFDLEEVDLEADEVERLDFGALIVTPPPNCEVRVQVAEGTDTIVSILVVIEESALELSAFAAPRTPGLWAEIRAQIIEQTVEAGGTADNVEGPFGTEVVRNVPVQLPDGRRAFQPTRTWVAEGPRWLLRGVLMGKAALSDEIDDDVVGPLFDAFADIIVRRGDNPMPVGDLLPLTLPPEAQAQPVPPQG